MEMKIELINLLVCLAETFMWSSLGLLFIFFHLLLLLLSSSDLGHNLLSLFKVLLNFLWGLQDSGLNNFIYCVAGFQFESKTLPFSLFFFIQSFFCFVGIFLQALLKNKLAYLIYFTILGAFSLFAWLLFMFAFEMKLDEKKEEEKLSK